MTTYQKFICFLREAAVRAGGKSKLLNRLDTSKPTFYRAIAESGPVLPATKVLCRWCDELDIEISMPGKEMNGQVGIKRVSKNDLENLDTANETHEKFFFPNDWFEENNINPKNCVIVSDVSLDTSVMYGDNVLVDISQTELKDDCVFIVAIGNGEKILRRCQYMPGILRLWSGDSPPIYVTGEEKDIFVFGRALWVGKFRI